MNYREQVLYNLIKIKNVLWMIIKPLRWCAFVPSLFSILIIETILFIPCLIIGLILNKNVSYQYTKKLGDYVNQQGDKK